MNEAIRSHIGGKAARKSLNSDGDDIPAGPGRKMPKEAIQFAKSMGVDMTGIEAEAEDMWRMLTDMHEKNPLDYHSFVKQQFDDAKQAAEEEKEMKEIEARTGKRPTKKGNNEDSDKGKFFRPEAGFAFKAKTDGNDGVKVRVAGDAGRELMINVCHHRAVQAPLDKNGQEVLDDRMSADGLQIPLVVGPVRELTLIDNPLGVDVVVHPSVTMRCDRHSTFLAQVVDLVLEWIKEETDVKIFRPKSGGYWKMCTNKYMGGRGENGETPVLFPMEYATDQGRPKEERSTATAPLTTLTGDKTKPEVMSAPSTLLSMMREDAKEPHDNSNDAGFDFLSMDSNPAPPKKSLIQDLSAPVPKPVPKAAPVETKPKTKKNPKASVKKGFLNNPKAAGSLYPEGSGEGDGGASGGTYARFMSKCQVVDTSTISEAERDEAMKQYASTGNANIGPAPAPKRKEVLKQSAKAPKPPADDDRLVAEMEKLMGQVDDQWETKTSMTNEGIDTGIAPEEWDSVFKDLAKSLGATGGIPPHPSNASPNTAAPAPVPLKAAPAPPSTAPALAPSAAAVRGGCTDPPAMIVPKAYQLTHTMAPDVGVAVEQFKDKGRLGVTLKLSNIAPELMATADVQVSKTSLKVVFSPTASVHIACKHILEDDSIIAKTSKKKRTLSISAFMLKI